MQQVDNELPDKKPCIQCGTLIALDGNFCNQCGAKQFVEDHISAKKTWNYLTQTGLFYGISITACALAKYASIFETFSWGLFFDLILAINAIGFFAISWKENQKILQWKSFSWSKLAAYSSIAMAASVLVHYSVGWLNLVIYSKDDNYYEQLKGSIAGGLLVVSLTAVMPAIFEELGFRGYLLQTLLKITDKEQAVFISAFLFAILHFSFVSLFWLIPFALFAGFVRIKENTLWYGVFFHFCFNLTACIFELL